MDPVVIGSLTVTPITPGTLTVAEADAGGQHVSSKADLLIESDTDLDGVGDLIFKTGGVERMRVTALGIGSGFLGGAQVAVGSPSGASDSAAIQAAHDSVFAAGGGIVQLSEGVYQISAALVWRTGVVLRGAGPYATMLKLANSANDDVFRTVNFSTLTGSGNPVQGSSDDSETNCGPSRFGIEGLTVDGNKANNTSGYGLRIYGYDFWLNNVRVRNCAQDGIYSEWGTDPSVPNSSTHDSMEADLAQVKSHHNGGNGVTWKGPHDSRFDRVASYLNGGNGFYHGGNDGGTQHETCHAYANSKSGYVLEKAIRGTNVVSESHPNGYYQLDIQSNGNVFVGASFFASGATGAAAESGVRFGTASTLAVLNNLIEGNFSLLNGAWVNFADDGGANVIRAVGALGTGATFVGTPNSGTVYQFATGSSSTDDMHVRQIRAGNGASGTTLLDQSGRILVAATGGSGFVELAEQSADPGTTSGRAKLFSKDNGSGKAQLAVRLGTDTSLVLGTEGVSNAGRKESALAARGLLVEAYDLGLISGGAGQPVGNTGSNNTAYLTLLGFRKGDVVTDLVTFIVGAGTGVSLFKLALLDALGNFLMGTADIHASLTANAYLFGALSSPYTILADGGYYVEIVSIASSVQPTIPRPGSFTNLGTQINSKARSCAQVATQTDIGGNVTPADSNLWYWAAAA